MSALSRDVHCFWFCSTTQNQRLLKESIKIDAKIRENTPTCDVGTSGSPGRTALGGVSSLSRKCSSLQQEVRGFSSFALFCDWAGGSDQVMSALSRDVHCFWFCLTTQNQRLLKESIKIDAKIRENTPTCDVGTSGSPGRTALGGVSSLSRKCSSLQQEVRGFSSFALFCDWAGGSDQVMSALSRDVHCFWFCLTTQNQRLLKESIKIDAKIRENTPTCDVGTSGSPGRTALGGVSSLSRKCSSLQQEVRGFSSFALFCN